MKALRVYRAKDGWRWKLVARNGRIVAASSEAFVDKRGAERNLNLTADMLINCLG